MRKHSDVAELLRSLPAETANLDDRTRPPEYVINWPALYLAGALAGVIAIGMLAGWVANSVPKTQAELDPVVRLATVQEFTASNAKRVPAISEAANEEFPPEFFRTRVIREQRVSHRSSSGSQSSSGASVPRDRGRAVMQRATGSLAGVVETIDESRDMAVQCWDKVVEMRVRMKRIQFMSDEDLLADLKRQAREFQFDRGLAKVALDSKAEFRDHHSQLAHHQDLKGIPFRGVEECKLEGAESKGLQEISREVRRTENEVRLVQRRYLDEHQGIFGHDRAISGLLRAKRDDWKLPSHVGGLEQTLQVQETPLRKELVDHLARMDSSEATRALARRAVFDLNADVRKKAIDALGSRPLRESRPVLLAAFRNPWRPAAAHAAEAMVALEDRQVVCDLVELLDAGDPAMPRQNVEQQWVVSELTKVNHLRNCVLCHAPMVERSSLFGAVPTEGSPLPVAYYSGNSRVPLVRADVTYLKQDFSVMEVLERQDPWPAEQRFDYFVRERPLSEFEIARHSVGKFALQSAGTSYRGSVLFALRSLTGESLGETAQEWRDRLHR